MVKIIEKSSSICSCYGTITNPLMDSSKSDINREPSTLVGWDEWSAGRRDWIFDWQVNLPYSTTFLCILLLQYILKLIPCSKLSFRGPKLGPHQFINFVFYIFNQHCFYNLISNGSIYYSKMIWILQWWRFHLLLLSFSYFSIEIFGIIL